MRPQNAMGWVAFVLRLSARSPGRVHHRRQHLDVALEPIADVLDDIVFGLFGLAGRYWVIRVLGLHPKPLYSGAPSAAAADNLT